MWAKRACLGLLCALGCPAPQAPPPSRAHYDGPVIDVHIHFLAGDAEHDSLDALSRVLAYGRLRHVGLIAVVPRPDIDQTRRLNDQLAGLVRRHPRRLFAIGTVHPGDGAQAMAELERIKAMGFRMLKLHPIMQELDVSSDDVESVVRKASTLGLPVLFDFSGIANSADLGAFVMLAARVPEARIVLAHMGGTRFHEVLLLSVLQRYPWYRNNMWVDLSAVAAMYADSPYRDLLVHVIRKIGVNRVLFGSDVPFARTTSMEAIADVEKLGLTPAEERLILHDNAASLLGLE